jgi:hypothetical protein
MPGNERDPLEHWLAREIQPLPPPPGTFELIRKRARRRKAGRLAVTVTSAAAVAVLATVGVPAVLSLHLGPSATATKVADGRPDSSATSRTATTPSARASTATSTATPKYAPSGVSESTRPAGSPAGGPVPSNFQPTSITFVSSNVGWAIGQAGTPGQCANAIPTICTSIVRTSDDGQTWKGIPAPSTSKVSGIRFLDGINGWAYGPDLWSTHNGGSTWTQVNTGGQQVIDLETAGQEAFAAFANCSTPAGSGTQDCTSYTLKTTGATADDWVDVGPATSNLPDSAGAAPTIVLSGGTGWLLAPDGTIYSGPLDGAWTRLGDAPCPATPSESSLGGALLSYDTYTNEFVAACTTVPQSAASKTAQQAVIYTSGTTSLNWRALAEGPSGGNPVSLSTTPSSQAILATSQGISVLDTSTGQWTQTVTLAGGFTYVGMTTKLQGVAIPANTSLHQIWMTLNGGRTWQPYTLGP